MATGYTTVAHNETVSFAPVNPPFQIQPRQFEFSYAAPTGKRWVGTAYATNTSSGADAAPSSGGPVGDQVRVSNNGQAAFVRVTVNPPSGYVGGTPLNITVNVAAIDA
jgi:hypothetical protein